MTPSPFVAAAGLQDVANLKTTAGPKPPFAFPVMVAAKGPETRSFANALVDGALASRVNAGLIECNAGSVVDLSGARLVNAPRDFVIFAGASLTAVGAFVGSFGMLSAAADHLEAIFVHAGKVLYRRSLFDLAGSPIPKNTLTGNLFFKSTGGQIDATIDHCLISGAAGLGPYAMQVASAGYDINLAIGHTGIQRGTSGYIGLTKGVGKITITDLGGNFDLDTGAPINLAKTLG